MRDLKNKIIQGDCLEKLKELEDNSVNAVVTDPPYGLGFMGKEWDTFDKSQFGKAGNEGENDLKVKKNFNILPRYNTDGLYDFTKNWAKECLRVLKPGGYLLSFAGTRTQHKIAMGIEDAGFEIRDMIMWCYGSGFPKSLNIGKAVDRLQGNKRKTVREYETHDIRNAGLMDKKGAMTISETKGTSEWEGWRTALKPAWESITVAQKQLDTSGLSANVYNAESIFNGLRLKLETIHELFAEEPVISKAGRLDLRPNLSPIIMSRKPLSEKTVAENCLKWGVGGINIDGCRVGTEEMGGGTMPDLRDVGAMSKEAIGIDKLSCGQNPRPATRKEQPTYQGRFPANLIIDGSNEVVSLFPNDSQRFFYCAKASKSERNMGCEELEEKMGGSYEFRQDGSLDGSIPSNSNNHPTVKPISLMEYLVKLVSREGATVLDPFMGSGSTGMACKNLNRDFIGIEKEPDYCKIAEARIRNTPTRLF